MGDPYQPGPEVVEIVGTVQAFGELSVEHPDLGDLYITARRAWLAARQAGDDAGMAAAHIQIEAAIDLAEAYRGQPYTDRERDTVRYLARARGRRS
jgi:hypothetical protein